MNKMNTMIEIIKKNELLYRSAFKLRTFYRKLLYSKYKNYPRLNGKIHPLDMMFKGNVDDYIKVGQQAVDHISDTLKIAGLTFDSLRSVLDIPSGYARILRFLVSRIDPGKITVCDIEEEAINFCEREYRCKKLLSTTDLSKLKLPEKYSLIWVGSLFTHLDEVGFKTLLNILFNSLDKNGILVFTTHGSYSIEIFNTYWGINAISKEELILKLEENKGFYFTPYHNSKEYGISVSLEHYVRNIMNIIFGVNAKVLQFKHRGWDDHQDIFSIQKLSDN